MTDEEIAELMKYSSPNEFWIVNRNGKLECLKCPFRVKLKYNIGELFKGQIVLVNKVKITKDLQSVYVIVGKAYYSQHFIII